MFLDAPHLIARLGMAALLFAPPPAIAQQVRVSGLSDVAYGMLTNVTSDTQMMQFLCVYSDAKGGRYEVTATGDGKGGEFILESGNGTLAYEVQWSATGFQKVGTALKPGVALTGLSSTATDEKCSSSAGSGATTATLITILRGINLSAAIAGDYKGSLTILVAPN